MANFVSTMFKSGEEFEAFLNNLATSKGLSLTYTNGNIYLKKNDTILGTVRLSSLIDNSTVKIPESSNEGSNDKYIEVVGIKNQNKDGESTFNIWVGTQAQYDAISEKDNKTLYFRTDHTLDTIQTLLEGKVTTLSQKVTTNASKVATLENWKNTVDKGTVAVGKANEASKITSGYKYYTATDGKVTVDVLRGQIIIISARGEKENTPLESMVVLKGNSTSSANGYYCIRTAENDNTSEITFYTPNGTVYTPNTVYVRVL